MYNIFIRLIVAALFTGACNLTRQQMSPLPPATPTSQTPTEVASCFFSAYGIGAPHSIYASADRGTAIAQADVNDVFPLVAITEYWYQINVGEQTGFVSRQSGGLSGECDTIPLTRLLAPPPEGVCSLRLDTEQPVINVLDFENLQPGQTPRVVAQMPTGLWLTASVQSQIDGQTTYKITLPDGQSGWLQPPPIQQVGLINGPCDSLPVEVIHFIGG